MARRATLTGERTAGAMLTALPHPLRDGWVATIPEADFIAADRTRLEGQGVELRDLPGGPNHAFSRCIGGRAVALDGAAPRRVRRATFNNPGSRW